MTASITNAGEYDGAEVVQLYVAPKAPGGATRPVRELKGFSKIHLKRGETGQVSFRLDRSSFAIYDPVRREWVVEAGRYDLEGGADSQDIRLSTTIHLQGVEPARTPCSGWYYTLKGVPSKKDFITIHPDYPEDVPQTRGTYDMTSSVREMQETSLLLRLVYRVLKREAVKHLGVQGRPGGPGLQDGGGVGRHHPLAGSGPLRSQEPAAGPGRVPSRVGQRPPAAGPGDVVAAPGEKGWLTRLAKL